MTRHAYIDRDRKLILFWSPKCACTSLANWFTFGLQGKKQAEIAPAGGPRPWLARNGYAIGHVEALELIEKGGFHTVAVTRKPLDRAISAFHNKYILYRKDPLDRFERLEPFARRFYCDLRGVTPAQAKESYEGLSFVEFLGGVAHAVRDRGYDEPKLNPHWNTQVPFLYRQKGVKYDEIIDISDLSDGIARLNERYGVHHVPGKSNVTRYGKSAEKDLSGIRSVELSAIADTVSKESLDSDEVRRLVAEAYAIDFEVLGYPEIANVRVPKQGKDIPAANVKARQIKASIRRALKGPLGSVPWLRPKTESAEPEFLKYFGNVLLNQTINISLQHSYVYLETPKVASTSIKLTLNKFETQGLPKTHVEPHPLIVHSPFIKPYQLPDAQLLEILADPAFFKFAFVRNPFTRFVSAYKEKILGNKPEKGQILRGLGQKEPDFATSVTFDEFLDVVCSLPDRRLDKHWMPQHLLTLDGFVKLDFVGHLETYPQDFAKVCERIGVPPEMITERRDHATNTTDASLSLEPEAVEKIVAKYRADFDAFGYSTTVAAKAPAAE